jgi:hypothetical protein
MSQTKVPAKSRTAGFVLSTEMMLIALILMVGLVTGWVKFRDQSLAEFKDTMGAIDAYILGSGPLWQTGGTRWIKAQAVVEPSGMGSVTEAWGAGAGTPAPAAVETAPGSHIYTTNDNFLVYGSKPVATTSSTSTEDTPAY